MKRYLLNITFCAGSNLEEDVDRDIFVLNVDREIGESEMITIFETVNELLKGYDEEEDFPISYEENGININTLMEGVAIFTRGTVCDLYSDCRQIAEMDNYYVIEQWQ